MEQGFLDFARQYGLPFALVLFALITGYLGKWYFGNVVTKLEKAAAEQLTLLREQTDARLNDKDVQIAQWQEAAKLDAQTSQESLRLMQGVNETLVRIEKRLEVQLADTQRQVREK